MKILRTRLLFASLICLIAGGTLANDAEREALVRIAHEIDALEPLVASAEEAANAAKRVRFRYDWLRQDLARVRAGLLEHARSDRNEPRPVTPLRGDYRR